MASELPDCPLCGDLADPRWWYGGVMFCDGCHPGVSNRPNRWLEARCDYALKRRAALETAERDTEARIVTWLRAHNKDEWSAEVRGRVEWYATQIDRGDHRKGAEDGE